MQNRVFPAGRSPAHLPALLLLVGVGAACGWGQERESQRVWGLGPLKPEEFREPPDPQSKLDASTTAHIRYRYQWRTQVAGSSAAAWLHDVEVYSEFDGEHSWIRPNAAKSVIDHEQGHFDLMEIYARKLHAEMIKLKPKLVFRARSDRAAIHKLKAKLDEMLQECLAECEDAQKEYDYQTKHGLARAAQSLHRRKHRESLNDAASKPPQPRDVDRDDQRP